MDERAWKGRHLSFLQSREEELDRFFALQEIFEGRGLPGQSARLKGRKRTQEEVGGGAQKGDQTEADKPRRKRAPEATTGSGEEANERGGSSASARLEFIVLCYWLLL